VLTRYPKNVVGVVVVPSNSGFSVGAIQRARTSKFNIILTDDENVCSNIVQFVNEHQMKDINFNFIFLFFFIFNTFLLSLLLIK